MLDQCAAWQETASLHSEICLWTLQLSVFFSCQLCVSEHSEPQSACAEEKGGKKAHILRLGLDLSF